MPQGVSPRYGSAGHTIAGSETHSLGTVYLEYIRGCHWGFWGCHWATGGVTMYVSAGHTIAGSEMHSSGKVFLEYIRGCHWGFWGCHWAMGVSPRYGSADRPIAGSETHSLGRVLLEYIRDCNWASGGVAILWISRPSYRWLRNVLFGDGEPGIKKRKLTFVTDQTAQEVAWDFHVIPIMTLPTNINWCPSTQSVTYS